MHAKAFISLALPRPPLSPHLPSSARLSRQKRRASALPSKPKLSKSIAAARHALVNYAKQMKLNRCNNTLANFEIDAVVLEPGIPQAEVNGNAGDLLSHFFHGPEPEPEPETTSAIAPAAAHIASPIQAHPSVSNVASIVSVQSKLAEILAKTIGVADGYSGHRQPLSFCALGLPAASQSQMLQMLSASLSFVTARTTLSASQSFAVALSTSMHLLTFSASFVLATPSINMSGSDSQAFFSASSSSWHASLVAQSSPRPLFSAFATGPALLALPSRELFLNAQLAAPSHLTPCSFPIDLDTPSWDF